MLLLGDHSKIYTLYHYYHCQMEKLKYDKLMQQYYERVYI